MGKDYEFNLGITKQIFVISFAPHSEERVFCINLFYILSCKIASCPSLLLSSRFLHNYQLILKPEEVGTIVVSIPDHQCSVALLQVASSQSHQGPYL